MPDRIVRVRLAAVISDYEKGMRAAAEATHAVGSEAEKLAQKKQAFQQLGTAGLALGAVLATGFAVATKASMDFDAQMSSVQAATHETAANMDELRQAALDAGQSTVYSATEAAQAIEELAKAGVSTKDILGGGLTGALDLAAAGGIAVGDAAGIAATALKQFNLNGSDMAHVADLLAAGAGKAMGDVTDLAEALNQSALVAKQTGLSVEETTAGLAAFAEQGLLGSDAGTSFKAMLQSLNPTSAAAADLMKKYNLEAFDAQGNFVGLATYAGKLKSGLSGLSTEQQNSTLKTIFGADAVRAATVLYQNGAEGIDEWTAAVDDQGYAASTAATRLDNLKGDVEALGGAFETALIDSGSAANDTLRTMVQAISGLIGLYNEMPAPVQASVMALGGAAAAVALTGGAAFLAVPKWLEFKATVEASTWSMKGIGITAGVAGLALGGLFMIVGELAAEHQRAQAKAQSYASTLADGTHEITDATRDLIAEGINAKQGAFLWLEGSSMADAAKDLGLSLDVVRKAIEGDADALDALNSTTQEAIDGYNAWDSESIKANSSAEFLRQTVEKETGALDQAAQAARDKAEATSEGSSEADIATDAYLDEAASVQELTSQLMELIDTINEANGVGQDAISQNIQYQDSLAAVQQAIADGAWGLDEATEAGRQNMEMLVGLASDSQAAAAAQLELDGSTEGYIARMREGREALINSATAMGYTQEQAVALADKVYAIPTEAEITAIMHTAAAQTAIDNFVNLNGNRTVNVWLNPKTQAMNDAFASYLQGHATGGPVIGPGTGTSDSIIRRLSNGEHVLTAREVQAAGGHSQIEEWRAALAAGPGSQASFYARQAEPVYMTGSQIGSGGGGWSSTPAQLPPIYIQSPVTGEYLLAQTVDIADSRIKNYDDRNSMITRGGRRP
ncbi:phage tail tape measure protein [Microbacterium sp. K24]|uniref:phage tail tape measure protein n=1 Tax=Microbacterium sp. K24 TaxID=2305446 RepID=UPI0014445996|nr:phage tail tape measure protein [Microbacterium sp. K24]